VVLAGAALALVWPADGYQLGTGEAELDTVAIGKLEIGMTVRAKDGQEMGTVTKFIRRENRGRAEELAVVKFSEESERAAPLTALVPLDAGAMQYANR
jgi:hypothetical protein